MPEAIDGAHQHVLGVHRKIQIDEPERPVRFIKDRSPGCVEGAVDPARHAQGKDQSVAASVELHTRDRQRFSRRRVNDLPHHQLCETPVDPLVVGPKRQGQVKPVQSRTAPIEEAAEELLSRSAARYG